MERPEEEQFEMETQALSTTASRASRASEAFVEAEEEAAQHPAAQQVEELVTHALGARGSADSLVRQLLHHVVPSPGGSRDSLIAELLRRAVPSPISSRDAFLKALGLDLVRRALPTPTSSQDLRPGVVTFRPTGTGEGDHPLTPDCEYLRRHLGEPLVAALAEVAAKRPRDPIHYLGHWLFRWRADSELREAKKKKMEELHMERERVAAERRAREEEERRAMIHQIAGDMVEDAFGRTIYYFEQLMLAEEEGEEEEEEEDLFT